MQGNRLSLVFPAFASDYHDHPGHKLAGFDTLFYELLQSAARFIDPSLADFDFVHHAFREDELRTQYITYIYSCAVSGILRDQGFVPCITAGYSMGIYAALYDAGGISFETGLKLIQLAFLSLKTLLSDRCCGMGTLIGLDRKDIQHLIDASQLRVEITNQNATHSFVVSGWQEDIVKLLEDAKTEGALHVRDLGVSVPYHSQLLKPAATDFEERIIHLKFSNPGNRIISLIDQRLLSTEASIRREVVRNLYQPLDWLKTMQALLAQNITGFVECGPSSGLVKNAKFVEGNYRFYSPGHPVSK